MEKLAKSMNGHKEEKLKQQMKMNRCSISFIITEMQITRRHISPKRLVKLQRWQAWGWGQRGLTRTARQA